MRIIYYVLTVLNVDLVLATYRIQEEAGPKTLAASITMLHSMLAQFSLVFGIGFVLMSIYKYTEYRQNPLANPLGRVISLLLTGAALIGLYYIPMQTSV